MTLARVRLWLASVAGDPRASDQERSKHAAHAARRFARNYARSAIASGVAAAVVGVSCLFFETPGAGVLAATGFVLALALLAGAAVAPRWQSKPEVVIWYNMGIGVLAAAAVGVAAGIGDGFLSWGGAALLLFWLNGTALVATRPRYQVAGISSQATAFAIPVAVVGSSAGIAVFVGVVFLAGGACLLTGLLREAADLRRYVDVRRQQHALKDLERTNADLERLAKDLASIVDDQLEAVVAQRKDVQRLHRLLHVQDADRSHELSRALATVEPRAAGTGRLPIGRVVGGRARILQYVASGGFGDVYLAEDLASREEVVVKVLHSDGPTDPARLKRFVLEAAAAAAARHPAIVRVYHVDVERDGMPFMICERVHGETLRVCSARGPIPLDVALPIFSVIVDAVAAVHRAGLVHRDIKPENVMVGSRAPQIRLLDFGVSRWVGEDFALTNAGELIGSVGYMSPEQIAHRPDVGAASDVFAMGLTLWECLADDHPLATLTPAVILRKLSQADIPRIEERVPELPLEVAELVHSMVALDPKSRPDVGAIAASLAALQRAHGARTLADAARWLLERSRAEAARVVAANAPTIAAPDVDGGQGP